MSYISAKRIQNKVLVWERVKGKRTLREFPVPWNFFTEVKQGQGSYLGLFGQPLIKHEFRTKKSFNEALQRFVNALTPGQRIYESDISPESKILSEYYYNVPAPKLNITFLDIEVDYDEMIGFSSIDNPYAPINSVALYHQHSKETIVYAVPPPNWTGELSAEVQSLADIYLCKDEEELLRYLLAEIQQSDVLSGWNSEFFDIPYIWARVMEVFGHDGADLLSFSVPNRYKPKEDDPYPYLMRPRKREVEKFGTKMWTIDLVGRLHFDYLALFKKYEMAERPSYKLESIADEVLPDLPKLEYKGSLHRLYRENFDYFLRYNIRDTEILKGFEHKLGYVALANEMYHLSCADSKDVNGTIQLADKAAVLYCHNVLNVRVPNKRDLSNETSNIQGAYVLEPQVGLHKYIASIDINSLYPSSIRSLNISPEKIIGQFVNKEDDWNKLCHNRNDELCLRFEDGTHIYKPANEWRILFHEKKWAVSAYGTIFDQSNGKGFIPAILEDWYATRKIYQRKKNEALSAKDNESAGYYDRLQYTYKIKLNSFYGALTNRFFRFYDLRMGESTTSVGRAILRHQCAKVAELIDGQYSTNSDCILYGDTDSVYFATHAKNDKQAVKIGDYVAQQTSNSFDKFMRDSFLCQPTFDNIIKAGREVIADAGIFVEKKRYVLHVIDDEGQKKDKLKVMGLDLKKTTTPKPIQQMLSTTIKMILSSRADIDVDDYIIGSRETIEEDMNFFKIGLPKGVQNIDQYTMAYNDNPNTRLPGHVAACIHYNICLKEYNDKESIPIKSGMKIKVFYLKNNRYSRFKSIALPTDLENVPKWFVTHYQDEIDKGAHSERLLDNNLKNIFKAINRKVPTKQTKAVADAWVWE